MRSLPPEDEVGFHTRCGMDRQKMNPGDGDTRMPPQVGDLVEQLRRLSWEVRISRDQLLNVAERLPSRFVERAQQTAEKLMELHRTFVEMSTKLPAESEMVVPAEVSENMAGLCGHGQQALRELDVLINELHDFFTEMPVSKTN